MNPNTDEQMAFGGVPRQQTISDIELGSVTPQTSIPSSYTPAYSLPIKMQAQQPDCGANSGAELKQVFDAKEFSEEYLWKKIKLIDGIPDDSGTTMLAVMKALNKTGVCDLSLLPNNPYVSEQAFSDPSVITPAMDSNASQNKVGAYAFQWSPTFQDIKTAIYYHKAVILLMRVGSEFWVGRDGQNSWRENDILPLQADKPITSGHFVVAYAYDQDYVYFINSWSNAWGRNGIGYFGEDYASRVEELGTAVDITSAPLQAILSYGSRGSAVSLLQKKLGLPVDGIFGSQTKAAVEAFQAAHNLTPDGIVGVNTNAVLNSGTLSPMDTTTQSAQASPMVSPITSTVTVTPTVAKPWYTSKTLWFAVLTGIGGVIVALQGIYPTAGILITIASVINGILRFTTDTALS